MIAIQLTRPGVFEEVERNEPVAGAGEALVAVRRIGICGTDWHAMAGRQPFFEYPRVLGHELGVEILALGPNAQGDWSVGQRCAVEPYLNDPASPASLRGKTNCCENLRVLGVHMDGGMCQRLALPLEKLHRSEKLSCDQLALTETLCIGAHAVERAQLREKDRVLIIGAGPIGMGVAAFSKMEAGRVAMVEVDPGRLAFLERTQAEIKRVQGGHGEWEEEAAECLGGRPTVIFDATGRRESMEQTFSLVAHGGKLVFVGLFQGNLSFSDPEFHRKELTVLASRNATRKNFKRVIEVQEKGLLDVGPWITDRLELRELPRRIGEGSKTRVKLMVNVAPDL